MIQIEYSGHRIPPADIPRWLRLALMMAASAILWTAVALVLAVAVWSGPASAMTQPARTRGSAPVPMNLTAAFLFVSAGLVPLIVILCRPRLARGRHVRRFRGQLDSDLVTVVGSWTINPPDTARPQDQGPLPAQRPPSHPPGPAEP